MGKSLVSVVIPVYNMEQYLAETLDSVLASDYPSLEVIVMDDGSKDRSLEIARGYEGKDTRIKVYTQPNGGACAARNHAIRLSQGGYILPVDADNLISPTFISDAVAELEKSSEVKVVCPTAEFIGERSGEWKLPPFSLNLLARKNMMDTCALYRKEDWIRAGGYCEEIIAREDWEFWISVLKDGGKVVRLPQVGLYYRVRVGSKRLTDRALKRHVVNVLNKRHPEFFARELGGPLSYYRSWSKALNRLYRFFHPREVFVSKSFNELDGFMKALPVIFRESGETIYKGRNELKRFERNGREIVVKSYQIPHLINRIVYRFFRSSKACRSYRYAELLREIGVGSPEPVGYYNSGNWLLFGHSYFASLQSECPYTYRDFATRTFSRQEEILRTIARTTATLHEHGILHKDYSAGNILFRDDKESIEIEIIDLNRIRFGKVSLEEGCKNFDRLPGTPDMIRCMAEEYAKARGFDVEKCYGLIKSSIESNTKKQ